MLYTSFFSLIFLGLVFTSTSASATRTKEALEQFDVKSLKLWIVYKNKCGTHAVLLDPKGYSYTIQLGSYVGKDVGMVTKITKNKIFLREVYQDDSGEWKERDAFIEKQNFVSSRLHQ